MNEARLILADIHPLTPFTVPGYQFSCRAVSLSQAWPGPVSLWLPGPGQDEQTLRRRTGLEPSLRFTVSFGPPPHWEFLGLRLRSKAPYRAWLRGQLAQQAAAGERCILYFRTIKLAHRLLPVLRQHGLSYAYEPHEVFHLNARRPEELRRIEAAVVEKAGLLLPISYALKAELERRLSAAAPCLVAPLGHSGRNFSLPDFDPGAPPHFLYHGSLHKWKGLELACAATAGLGAPFEVVGDAGGLERCRRFCAERGYGHVRFHGQALPEELPRFYQPGSICLLPLSQERIATTFTSPLKVFDYLAAGRPVVAGDVPTMCELLTDRANARLVPVGDVAAWKAALTELLQDRALAAQLARNGRQLARSCTWSERARPIAAALQELLECPPGASASALQ
jgi:glycosyltransferase involved in cell wall biosynthesis